VSQCQKGKINLDFTEARDSEWQWQQLGHMQVCTLLQKHNHASTPGRTPPNQQCQSTEGRLSNKIIKMWLLKISSHLKCVVTLPCDLSLIMTGREYHLFLDIDISTVV